MAKDFSHRLGETKTNTLGNVMKIVEYNNATDIVVEFEDGYRVKSRYDDFKRGYIKNPYFKSVLSIGYVGVGRFVTTFNNRNSLEYDKWRSMLIRCYDTKYHEKQPTYIGCSVCEEWLCFQNFALWMEKNYYEIDGQKMQLDKDILLKGNRIYSPETCIFVPQEINNLFTDHDNLRGNCPVGVYHHKHNNRYVAQCSVGSGVSNYLGSFPDMLSAFEVYKNFKENHIKEVAEKYKDQIPQKLYNALLEYKINIGD